MIPGTTTRISCVAYALCITPSRPGVKVQRPAIKLHHFGKGHLTSILVLKTESKFSWLGLQSRLLSTTVSYTAQNPRLAGATRPYRTFARPAVRLKAVQYEGKAEVDRFKHIMSALTGDLLWAVILVPILAISWLGFYTIARAVGVPPIFAAGMSAAFDGVAIFAARIGLKHRRKGFSGYLARITVLAFAALGAFVQSFHAETHAWIAAHSWIVWATAPIAAVLAYELHLGWVHRRQLIRRGYHHPSAKSGFGPATWLLIGGTFSAYRAGLRARRDFIAKSNLARFQLEESVQPALAIPEPEPVHGPETVQEARPKKRAPQRKAARPVLRPVPSSPSAGPPASRPVKRPASARRPASTAGKGSDAEIAAWCVDNGIKLGYGGRVPIEGLRAYRAAHRQEQRAS